MGAPWQSRAAEPQVASRSSHVLYRQVTMFNKLGGLHLRLGHPERRHAARRGTEPKVDGIVPLMGLGAADTFPSYTLSLTTTLVDPALSIPTKGIGRLRFSLRDATSRLSHTPKPTQTTSTLKPMIETLYRYPYILAHTIVCVHTGRIEVLPTATAALPCLESRIIVVL